MSFNIKEAQKGDLDKLSEASARAYHDDPLFAWMYPGLETRKNLKYLFKMGYYPKNGVFAYLDVECWMFDVHLFTCVYPVALKRGGVAQVGGADSPSWRRRCRGVHRRHPDS